MSTLFNIAILSPEDLLLLGSNTGTCELLLRINIELIQHRKSDPLFQKPLKFDIGGNQKNAYELGTAMKSLLNKIGWTVVFEEDKYLTIRFPRDN